jgi:hypothetical protein
MKLPVFNSVIPSAAITAALSIVTVSADAALSFSASGANAASIQATVDSYRASLGALNANVAGSFGTGRREINWDGVPNQFAAPNNLPANFFNVNSPRGAVFSTPGTGFQVSANAGIAPVEFGNIEPQYPDLFAPFSAQRLFTALGSNVTDVSFFIPGSTTPALTRGFGSIFTDVDSATSTSIEYFDAFGTSLGVFGVPNATGNQTLSFFGLTYDAPTVSRVRITSGSQVLAPGNTAFDLVVMDDFIYGEPVPIPEPSSILIGLCTAAVPLFSRRRRRAVR